VAGRWPEVGGLYVGDRRVVGVLVAGRGREYGVGGRSAIGVGAAGDERVR